MENNIPDQSQSPIVVDQNAMISPTSQKNTKKIILIAIIVCITLVIIFGSFFIYSNNSNVVPTVTPGVKAPVITPVPTISSSTAPIKMSLIKGKVVTVPTTSVTIEYVGAILPDSKCFDCIATTDIALVKDDIRKILSYSCGGIAGKCTDKIIEYGLEVTLENSTDSTAQVSIKKQ